MEEAPRKGMSKGCLIGLIIGGIVLLAVIVVGIVCWVYKEDLAKASVGMMVAGVKTNVMNGEIEGVDTVQFNAMADAFSLKVKEGELDLPKYEAFVQTVQVITGNESPSIEDVTDLTDAMIAYFPELQEMLPAPDVIDSTAVEEAQPAE